MLSALILWTGLIVGQARIVQQAGVQQEPAMVQIRKSVAFIEVMCKRGDQTLPARGTGFFVAYPETRIEPNVNYIYLVTNRHVALCWDEGHPLEVMSVAVNMNLRSPVNDAFLHQEVLNQKGNLPWIFPEDDSVDLALIPLAPDPGKIDYKTIPISKFATKDVLDVHRIHEGEPLFFAGFFYQFPGVKKLEPIVRQGIIAMMPDEPFPFIGHPAHLYLADVHAFGGNSGSPAFINLAGPHDGSLIVGQDYKFFGIVNAEIFEGQNFELELTATAIRGTGQANSGISTIVPAEELKILLDSPKLQRMRDDFVAAHRK